MDLDQTTAVIIDSALAVHRGLGPGLLESVYETVLAALLNKRGLGVERQAPVPIHFDGMRFDIGFRADILVEAQIIIELKSVERLAKVHGKQLLTYLRLADIRVGLLINFGAPTLKEGLHRIVNCLPPSASPGLRVNRARMRSS